MLELIKGSLNTVSVRIVVKFSVKVVLKFMTFPRFCKVRKISSVVTITNQNIARVTSCHVANFTCWITIFANVWSDCVECVFSFTLIKLEPANLVRSLRSSCELTRRKFPIRQFCFHIKIFVDELMHETVINIFVFRQNTYNIVKWYFMAAWK